MMLPNPNRQLDKEKRPRGYVSPFHEHSVNYPNRNKAKSYLMGVKDAAKFQRDNVANQRQFLWMPGGNLRIDNAL